MGLTKSKGNMYEWVTHMWSPIRGCKHECLYCYGKKYFPVSPALNGFDLAYTRLGKGNVIFVGHLCDMWGWWVSKEDIIKVLSRCMDFPENQYIFQSKNPFRFKEFRLNIPFNSVVGTTIETDGYPNGFKTKAPPIMERFKAMRDLSIFRKFVTIEPIMDFHVGQLAGMIYTIQPEFVTIGADSKGHGLIEPSWEKVQELINTIRTFTEIRQKTNLERLRKV